MKLNMGCGQNKIPGYVNIDKYMACTPDIQMDLEAIPWNLSDNSVSEMLFNHCLEHVGASADVFLKIIQEIYRVSRNGATIQVNVPHPRHDFFINDPTHVRAITPDLFALFSKRNNLNWANSNVSNSPLALYLNVDFEIVSNLYVPDDFYLADLQSGALSAADFERISRTTNNAISEYRITLRVVKK